MNEDKDPIGSLLKDMAREGKISPQAAGLEGEMAMPAMPVEQQPELESMAMPAMPMEPATPESMDIPELEEDTDDYVINISEFEGWHGATPKRTGDKAERDKAEGEKSKDVAFGHKLTDEERESGYIHGIRFIDENGEYIPLTKEQGMQILREDIKENVRVARADVFGEPGWDTKLEKIGSSWEELDPRYQNALSSLAMNVGGSRAGREWTKVLQAAANQNVPLFAKEMRRMDGGKHTDAMDNRVAKELYRAGIIDSFSEIADVLPLASADVAGIPDQLLAQR